jgi:hypothetical protein
MNCPPCNSTENVQSGFATDYLQACNDFVWRKPYLFQSPNIYRRLCSIFNIINILIKNKNNFIYVYYLQTYLKSIRTYVNIYRCLLV